MQKVSKPQFFFPTQRDKQQQQQQGGGGHRRREGVVLWPSIKQDVTDYEAG